MRAGECARKSLLLSASLARSCEYACVSKFYRSCRMGIIHRIRWSPNSVVLAAFRKLAEATELHLAAVENAHHNTRNDTPPKMREAHVSFGRGRMLRNVRNAEAQTRPFSSSPGYCRNVSLNRWCWPRQTSVNMGNRTRRDR